MMSLSVYLLRQSRPYSNCRVADGPSHTRHIDIRLYFVRDHVAKGTLALEYVPTQKNQADALTKRVHRTFLERFTAP